MKLYAFELGRKKDLCFAELVAVLGEKNLVEHNLDTAIFKLPKRQNPQSLQDSLGGTIKIVEIFNTLPKPLNETNLQPLIESKLEEEFKNASGKIPFSLTVLSVKFIKDINIKKILNFSKIFLKSLSLNSRFVNKNFRNTKPSTIYKAKVLQKGIDINLIQGNKEFYLGSTVAIQNIDAYSKRDYEKPARDAKIGMLPPKLAQIMINLLPGVKSDTTILDPFCGTGTILTEALLTGHNVVGSDTNPEMVNASEQNCTWLKKEFPQAKGTHRTFKHDARLLTPQKEKIDAIVTEGYLGPPLSNPPSPEKEEIIFRELANLHLNWLRAAATITNGPIVTAVAAFRINNQIHHLPKFDQIAQTAGYKILQTFTYDRPDQVVARDIYVLQKL